MYEETIPGNPYRTDLYFDPSVYSKGKPTVTSPICLLTTVFEALTLAL